MKNKYMAVALFLLGANCSAGAIADTYFKLGVDSSGSLNRTISGTSVTATDDVNGSASMAFESFAELSQNADMGFGVEFQVRRKLTKYKGEFSFLPVYAAIRLHPELSDFTPYFAMQLGLSIFNADSNIKGIGETTPGAHVGIGVGCILDKDFVLELMATSDSGGVEYRGTPLLDVSYGKLTASVGAKF
jgi:hypothetical protein